MKPATIQRKVIPELMDHPDATAEELTEDLRDLIWLNRFGWGAGLMWECVRGIVQQHPEQRQWTMLDIATGSADIPCYLARWARRRRLELRITATDLHPVTLELARRQVCDYPEIQVESANLLSLPYADRSFDIVSCSQALHHFGTEDIITALRHMGRVARRAVVVSDLVRSGWGHGLVWLIVHLTRASRFARHDGPASVRNGFKLGEMQAMAEQAGIHQAPLRRHRGLRFAISWPAPPS